MRKNPGLTIVVAMPNGAITPASTGFAHRRTFALGPPGDSKQGLAAIGVHTPEFSFEEDVDNVRKAAQERGVTYPMGIDNNRAIWSGFGNSLLAGALLCRCDRTRARSPLR